MQQECLLIGSSVGRRPKTGAARILLVDADSTLPNLALMKLSAHHKRLGDEVALLCGKLPYYPDKPRKPVFVPSGYDKVYCSVVFNGSAEHIIGRGVELGGTGSGNWNNLPEVVENERPDYSLYPDCDTSYGFITRGCIRRCSFCVVPKKEGTIRQVAHPSDVIQHKRAKLFDNNILAHPDHLRLLREIKATGAAVQFNQGLDVRLIDKDNSEMLASMKLLGDVFFSFDDLSVERSVTRALELLAWLPPFKAKFFTYIHPNMGPASLVYRVEWIRSRRCLPYVQRDVACWSVPERDFYVDVASYCNQAAIFKSMPFDEYLRRRHTDKERIARNSRIYEEARKQ